MTIKDKIDTDLKSALLSGDKELATTLRGIKSAILYEEVAQNSRESGLDENIVTQILGKEAKKRQESADLYLKGGSQEKAQKELAEKAAIEKYLPEQLSDEELQVVVQAVVSELKIDSVQKMGQVIGEVKKRVGSQADGSRIALAVKKTIEELG